MKTRTYTATLLLSWAFIYGLGAIVSFIFLQPLQGDLTRIGWFSEKDYGWYGTDWVFEPSLSRIGLADESYDIVIVGDSFSYREPLGGLWHNYLQRSAGKSVGVFHVDSFVLSDFVASPAFLSNPPDLVIYQSVERSLLARLGSTESAGCAEPLPSSAVNRVFVQRDESAPRAIERKPQGLIDVGYGLRFLWSKVRPVGQVSSLQLSTDQLFTNWRANTLLVYTYDLQKSSWPPATWDDARCSLKEWQRRIQGNGKTVFVAMVVPDKLTVYGPYLVDTQLAKISRYERLLIDEDLNVIPLLSEINSAIGSGAKDFYLPNDTHWSSSSERIVGESVVRYLQNLGM